MDKWRQGVIVQNADGRLEYLRAAAGGGFRHLWQMTDSSHEVANFFAALGGAAVHPTMVGWSPWAGVAGPEARSAIAVARNADGCLEVYLCGRDGTLHHAWQGIAGAAFGGWQALGGPWPGRPAVIANADGRLEIFMLGEDRHLYHNWQTMPNAALGGWRRHSGPWAVGADPVVAAQADGRLLLLMLDEARQIQAAAQIAPNGDFGPWQNLGGPWPLASRPAIGRNADGRLELFLRGEDRNLYYTESSIIVLIALSMCGASLQSRVDNQDYRARFRITLGDGGRGVRWLAGTRRAVVRQPGGCVERRRTAGNLSARRGHEPLPCLAGEPGRRLRAVDRAVRAVVARGRSGRRAQRRWASGSFRLGAGSGALPPLAGWAGRGARAAAGVSGQLMGASYWACDPCRLRPLNPLAP